MKLLSKVGLSVGTLAAISLGALGMAGCAAAPQEDVASSSAQPLTIIRASKETTQKLGIVQWTVDQSGSRLVARGVDAKGHERGLFELAGEIDASGKLTAINVRAAYGLKSGATRITRGAETPTTLEPSLRPFVERLNVDLEGATRAASTAEKQGLAKQGLALLDWEDECYECAGSSKPPPSPVSSACGGVSVVAVLACSASLISCGFAFVPGCATAFTGCGGLFATTVITCNATAPSASGGGAAPGGGGGGTGGPVGSQANSGSPGTPCITDWSCGSGYICLPNGVCGS